MASRHFVLVLGCLFSSCFFGKTLGKCPPENLIRPCICNRNSLVCNDINAQSVLDGVFRRLGDIQVIEFILRNSQVDHLIASSLKVNFFRRIRIMNSVLVDLFDDFPPYQNQLSHLALQNVTIRKGFHEVYLQPLTKLEYLTITLSLIPKLGKEFNMYLSEKIKRVGLFLTKTKSIDNAFVGKSELEAIHVQNASLISINRFTFPYPSNKLQMLTFDGNQIEKLDQDQFTYMSGLRVVSFAGNKISQVSEDVFGKIYDQLQILDLSGNPINCDCSIQWITAKNIEGNTVSGKCVAPPSVEGKEIVDLKPSDFVSCPVKSA